MAEVEALGNDGVIRVDVCRSCQWVWFDPQEYEDLPQRVRPPPGDDSLPAETRERLALLEIGAIREKARGDEWGNDSFDNWWECIPAVLGLPIEREVDPPFTRPWTTWFLILLISGISGLAFLDLSPIVQGWGLIPAHYARYGGLTFVTSFFLHGSFLHLLANMYFLWIFGDNVEDRLGRWRYILLLVLSDFAGNLLHILGDPSSMVPCIGASGGISGVLAFYALKFPRARIALAVRYYYRLGLVRMPAYALFFVWLAIQGYGVWAQLNGFSPVSALAHIGGALTGFVFWVATRKIQRAEKSGRGRLTD
jgi:membrane associated rhomboid family serine protease